MGRQIRQTLAGTKESFEVWPGAKNLVKVEGAELYVNGGTIAVIASQEWCDYLHGKTDVFPQPQGDDTPFEFDENEFKHLIGV